MLSISCKNNYIFEQEMFCSAPKKMTSKCLAQNDVKNDVEIDLLAPCTKLSYTPSYKTEISRTGENL